MCLPVCENGARSLSSCADGPGLATAVAYSTTTAADGGGGGGAKGAVRFRYGPSTASIMRRVDSDILLTPISHPVEEEIETSLVSAKEKQALVHLV